MIDDSFLILVNASDNGVEYVLPEPPNKTPWRQVLDTENIDDPFYETEVHDKVILGGRSVRVYSDGMEASAKAPIKQHIGTDGLAAVQGGEGTPPPYFLPKVRSNKELRVDFEFKVHP